MASTPDHEVAMPGGHECGKFFSSQVLEYSKRLADELPTQEYTNEEEQAGFKRISETFGFYATMDNIARYVGEDDETVLKWSVNKFYTKVKYLAWRADAQRKYQDILNKKSKS